jgi:hypothetical protein
MFTVVGEGRGFRVVRLREETGLRYQLRPVDLLTGVEKDTERHGVFRNRARRVHPSAPGRRGHDGRIGCDQGVPDGLLTADAACAGRARSRFRRVPAVSSPRRSRPRSVHLLRCRQSQSCTPG